MTPVTDPTECVVCGIGGKMAQDFQDLSSCLRVRNGYFNHMFKDTRPLQALVHGAQIRGGRNDTYSGATVL